MINKPPKEFFEFLEVVNFLRSVSLPSYGEAMRELEEIPFEHLGDRVNAVMIVLYKFIEQFPLFHSYLAGTGFSPESDFDKENVIAKYDTFQKDRELLLIVLQRQKKGQKDATNRLWLGMKDIPSVLFLTERGEIETKSIIGEIFNGVDLTRIRVCAVCSNTIFWAKRSDAKYCSKTCSNLYSTRQYLSNEAKRELHNEKRRGTYQSKKEQKEAQRKTK